MKTAPITPGTLDYTTEGVPHAPAFGDVYHPATGAAAQARHVFLAGNGLPGRWARRECFTILETGFGLGNNFLATWDAWRSDPERCERLIFISIEKHPLSRTDLARAHAASDWPALASQLLAAWPPATPNLHPRNFEGGRVQLLLGFGDVQLLLPQLLASVDAFFLDGFAPARNAEMWAAPLFKRLARLAAPGATAATWSAARVVRDGLAAAGFEVAPAAGIGGKRDITLARYAPRHVATAPAGGLHAHAGPREALIIGAGLAGCAAAWALSTHGWRCTLLDRRARLAQETSGQAAGLFHGAFHEGDGPHARLHRAAALRTQSLVAPWTAEGSLHGAVNGALRLDARTDVAAVVPGRAAHTHVHAALDAREHARTALATQALPADVVDWLDRDAARAACGMNVPSGGWWFADGGWLEPRGYAAALLRASGSHFSGNAAVVRITREGGIWRAFDADRRVLGEAPVLVLANALGAGTLLRDELNVEGRWVPMQDALEPLVGVRGQLSHIDCVAGSALALPAPRVPVAGAGYVLPCFNGHLRFGATSDRDDLDATIREADHHRNLAQLAQLSGGDAHAWAALPWQGRVGWRALAADRLPLIGALPDMGALRDARRADKPRHVPRLRDAEGGLYVFTGLGSRGIAWAALGAELLASWITGAPCPVEADLRDALDPARYALRLRRADS